MGNLKDGPGKMEKPGGTKSKGSDKACNMPPKPAKPSADKAMSNKERNKKYGY